MLIYDLLEVLKNIHLQASGSAVYNKYRVRERVALMLFKLDFHNYDLKT